jgi:hypothetical protein
MNGLNYAFLFHLLAAVLWYCSLVAVDKGWSNDVQCIWHQRQCKFCCNVWVCYHPLALLGWVIMPLRFCNLFVSFFYIIKEPISCNNGICCVRYGGKGVFKVLLSAVEPSNTQQRARKTKCIESFRLQQ